MRQQRTPDEACVRRDWSASVGGFLAVWVAPALAGLVTSVLSPSLVWTAGAWSLALAWMGVACLINARRCSRLHCYFSGPILLVGAASIAAVGFAGLELGPGALPVTIIATLGLAALTYVLELIWGRYVSPEPTVTRDHD
ncbi:MAG: hypothetical protein R3C25_14830 [Hyphomonadaceae bacterium]